MLIGFRVRKLLIYGLLATFSFAEDLGNDLQRLMQTRPNYEALKPIMKQMPQSPLDYFRKIQPYVPKNMADTFNQFLQYGEDREAKKGRKKASLNHVRGDLTGALSITIRMMAQIMVA